MVKKLNYLLFILIGLMLLLLQTRPDNHLRLIFCDVGQGDAILVEYKHKQILVDGGPDNQVLDCLGEKMAFWDRQLDLVVLTHPQADHLTGLIEVVKRYQVKQFLTSGDTSEIPEYRQLSQELEKQAVKQTIVQAGDEIRLGPIQLQLLWPQVLGASTTTNADPNQTSVVIRGSFGQFDWVLTGDISEAEERMLTLQEQNPIEVLKVSHHGSKYSNSQTWLGQLKPQLAVISVGENRFGHPTAEVLARLQALGAEIRRTDESGTIEVVSDGQSWYINHDNKIN